jgi:hypothetical protein
MSQSEAATIDRLLITGGGSQTDGLAGAIAGNIPTAIETVDPLAGLSIQDLGLGADQVELARCSSTTAIGLALWSVESPLIRLSVLPDEVMAARRVRRLYMAAGCGVAAFVGLLGVLGIGQIYRVHAARNQVHQAQHQVTVLTQEVSTLQAATAVHGQALARSALVASSLQGDVDWVRTLGQLATVMPSNLSLVSFQGTRQGRASASPSGASADQELGTVTFSVKGTGGLPAAKGWLLGLEGDPDLAGAWVTGIAEQNNGGSVTFTSSAQITTTSESHRDKAVQP